MICTRCGQPLQEGDRFCLNCGQPVESAWPDAVSAASPQQTPPAYPPQPQEPLPPAAEPWSPQEPQNPSQDLMSGYGFQPEPYPYYTAPPKKKKSGAKALIIAAIVLALALIITAVVLVVSITKKLIEEEPQLPPASWAPADGVLPSVNDRELATYLGATIDEVQAGTGLVLTVQNGMYANLDGSVSMTAAGIGNTVDMVILAERDAGFSLCGVEIGMDRDKARKEAEKTLEMHAQYDTSLISGQYGDNIFAAYLNESGHVDYIMYFTYGSDDLTGTGAGYGTGLWFIGETLDAMRECLGEETSVETLPNGGTAYYYEADGMYFITADESPDGDSLISAVSVSEGGWFSDDIYVGMTYDEISMYMDLSYVYVDTDTGYRVADYTTTLDGLSCVGTFMFDPMNEDGQYVSISAFVTVQE